MQLSPNETFTSRFRLERLLKLFGANTGLARCPLVDLHLAARDRHRNVSLRRQFRFIHRLRI
jgi:hypothetical protein